MQVCWSLVTMIHISPRSLGVVCGKLYPKYYHLGWRSAFFRSVTSKREMEGLWLAGAVWGCPRCERLGGSEIYFLQRAAAHTSHAKPRPRRLNMQEPFHLLPPLHSSHPFQPPIQAKLSSFDFIFFHLPRASVPPSLLSYQGRLRVLACQGLGFGLELRCW